MSRKTVRKVIRSGATEFNVADLVTKLDAEARADRQGRTADLLCRRARIAGAGNVRRQ